MDEIQNHIKTQGLEAIAGLKGETMATEFVENVLRVHGKYREMIQKVFQADQAFMGAMDKAMSAVINFRQPKTQSKSPELVRNSR